MKMILFFFLLISSANAAEFSIEGEKLIVRGFLDLNGQNAFQEQLINEPKIRQVVFTKCTGGHLGAGYHYAKVIRDRKLSTMIVGQAYSACALAFLAGYPRYPAEGQKNTVLSLHISRPKNIIDTNPPEMILINQRLTDYIDILTERKISPKVMTFIKSSNTENSGVYFVSSTAGFFNVYDTYYCDGKNGVDTRRCEKLSDANPYDMGIFKK